MFFDARKAKLLAPGEHLLVDGCQGLRLVATESTRTWVYRYKVGDKMKQARLGHWPAVPVQAAAAQWQAMRDAREAGQDPKAMVRRKVAQPKPTPSAYTVRALVDDYITGHLPNRSEASAEAARRALRRLMDEDADLASMAAASVNRARAFAVIESRKDYPTAAAKLKSLMAAAWDYAHDSGKLEAVNWWREVMRGRLKSKGKIVGGEHVGKTRRVLTLDEVRSLLAWSADHMHDTGRDVLALYLWTCTRGSEIVSMRPEHITDEKGQWWWTIPASLTKNAGNAHAVDLRVPLFGRALDVVQRRMGSGAMFDGYTQHFFSTYVYDLQPYSIKSQTRPERVTLPVTHWTPHDLRRTSRTLLAGLGCPNEIAEAILGHMPPNIVATYNRHSYDAERVVWLGRLSALLEA